MSPSPWLSVVGIGEDGIDGVSPAARALIAGAEVVVGGRRNLMLVAGAISVSVVQISWTSLEETLAAILHHRGRRVVVVASGDPMFYGVGVTLCRVVNRAEIMVVPHPGTFSLAAARLGWGLQDTVTLSIHGRPVASLIPHLAPGRRLLVLSEDGDSPAAVAALLTAEGFGPSRMVVLEHLGGTAERDIEGVAEQWSGHRMADLNTLAIDCTMSQGRAVLACVPGLPDDAYLHDGQITKREVRAVTLAALAPWPGALLWDIGAGAGSIAIEWLRAASSCQAVAVERDPVRAARIADNALRLGVPRLSVVIAAAPEGLASLAGPPDAVFIGGGVAFPSVLETCWAALRPGGRLIANAVTVAAEARLLTWQQSHGGLLVRLSVARLAPIGGLSGWHALAPVTQYCGIR